MFATNAQHLQEFSYSKVLVKLRFIRHLILFKGDE